jgi:formate hydrogenlyase subunit 4
MSAAGIINILSALLLAPLVLGVINRTKAFFAGRKGQPLFQLYYDLYKLFGKGAVYSRTTTWVFRAGPAVSLAAVLATVFIVPAGSRTAFLAFNGDLILLAYLFGLARFFMVLAAMDTGSSFEGMGASREVRFAVFAEPAFFLGLAALARVTGELSLSTMYLKLGAVIGHISSPVVVLVAGAFLIVLLTENSRIPVDDPNTHLELTMIHEVMVLDHSGPDLALISYGAALKLWVLGSLLVGMFVGALNVSFAGTAVFLGGMAALAVLIGAIESVMARLRIVKVPQLLIMALSFSALAFVFSMR